MQRFWKSAAVVAAFVVGMPAAEAAAQVNLSVAGGPSFPIGHLGEEFDLGYHVQLSAGLATTLPVGLRIDAGFNRFPETGGAFQSISGSVNGVLGLGGVGFAPYLIGGAGVYNSRVSHDEDEPGHDRGDESTTNIGANIGAGFRVPLTGLTIFVEARLHNLFSEGEQTRFIPLSFGFSF
jgi:hypothetical protein